MFNSLFLSGTKIQASSRLLSIAILCVGFFLSGILYSQDFGGFTDPKTPNRHSRVNIDSANIVVKPHGIYAEVTTEFWYRSVDIKQSTDTLELYAFFSLPKEDFMNDSWLWVGDTCVHAMIIDVNTASLIYENIVHRLHKDPSILYRRNTAGLYEYRIYPNVGNLSRHAKFSYWTKMSFVNGYAQFNFTPTVLGLSANKSIPRNYKFYLNENFTDIDISAIPALTNYSSDNFGKYVEFRTSNIDLKRTFSYLYDFSAPYFSKSKRIDGQEYYFAMFDSKLLFSSYVNQKINFLIDYDINKTNTSAREVIQQLKNTILSNLGPCDSINVMIGDKNTINLFDRWVPCHKDTINQLLDSTVYKNIGYFSHLEDLMFDGINFNKKMNNGASSIVLLTCSEYAPTPTTANPIIEKCLQLMAPNLFKITSVDFSDVHYWDYNISSKYYYGDQYFNEKIAEMTNSEYFSIKNTGSNIFSMMNSAFSNLKGTVSDIGLYVEPADGISAAKTTENLTDANANKKLVYEFGKLEGGYPIEIKFSALLDGKPVIKKYLFDESNIILNSESAKMWNWKYLRTLEDKKNKTKKESYDLTRRSITNRILTTQTAFLCLEPWMMGKDTSDETEEPTGVEEVATEPGLEISYGPNPVENKLNVSINITDENTVLLSVGIYDVFGVVVKEFNFDSYAKSINLNWDATSDMYGRVPPGVYYLVIKTSAGSKILKLVVV